MKKNPFDLSYFVGKNYFGNNGSQSYLILQVPFIDYELHT